VKVQVYGIKFKSRGYW